MKDGTFPIENFLSFLFIYSFEFVCLFVCLFVVLLFVFILIAVEERGSTLERSLEFVWDFEPIFPLFVMSKSENLKICKSEKLKFLNLKIILFLMKHQLLHTEEAALCDNFFVRVLSVMSLLP